MTRRIPQHLLSLPGGEGALYLKLYQRIRALILSGAWPAGTRLPSSRTLAADLGISRNTALCALDQLTADGWTTARAGSGVYVADDVVPAKPAAIIVPGPAEDPESIPSVPFEMRHAGIDLFPVERWAKLQAKVWSESSPASLYEGSSQGWYPLRQAVAAYLHASRGLECYPEQIIIVSSSQAAIDLATRVLTDPGDGVWVEDPGYILARECFAANDLRQTPLGVDEQGIRVQDGMIAASDARLVYVTPGCQFPTCTILSEDRRAMLLDWARSSGAVILEDDWDSDAVFGDAQAIEPLAQGGNDSVVFIHSFNRLLFPGLRIAALVVPPPLIRTFVDARRVIDGFNNLSNQMALTAFIESGELSAHLRKRKAAYGERRQALIGALARLAPDSVRIDPGQCGLQLVAHVRGERDLLLAQKARADGIKCMALGEFSTQPMLPQSALLLGFAAFRPDVLENAAERLVASLQREAL